eukprot:401802_1
MNNPINQPDFLTGLNDLNFPMDALERCTSNPLVRCYSNLSCTSQDGGATFVPYGRGQQCLYNEYIDVPLLPIHSVVNGEAPDTKEPSIEKAQPVPEEPPIHEEPPALAPPTLVLQPQPRIQKHMNVSSMKVPDLIRLKLSLQELLDHDLICRFFKDQNGSRYVQGQLCDNACSQIIDDVLKHIVYTKRNTLSLSLDIYGNYVMQILFELTDRIQRKLLFDHVLRGNVYRLTHSFYGCRVIQKAFDYLSPHQCTQLVKELNTKSIHQCLIGQNSNHVLQKILSLKLERKAIAFIIKCIRSDIYFYGTHMFGCRIVQSIINEYGELIDEIVNDSELILSLSTSEYGNYVVQDILCLPQEQYNKSLLRLAIFESVVVLSKNKFGSNVVEKCLSSCKDKERDVVLKQVMKNKSILKAMVSCRYANYVVQKLLIHSNHKQQSKLIYSIEKNIPNLRSLPHGKHISDKIRKIKQKYKSGSTYSSYSVNPKNV